MRAATPQTGRHPHAASTPQAASTTPLEAAYWDWLQIHLGRQEAALRAAPSGMDASPAWRREQARALDTWGALIQEARDRRPPLSNQTLHTTLLDALDRLDRGRLLWVEAIASGQEPSADAATQLRVGGQALDEVGGERARHHRGSPNPNAAGEHRPATTCA